MPARKQLGCGDVAVAWSVPRPSVLRLDDRTRRLDPRPSTLELDATWPMQRRTTPEAPNKCSTSPYCELLTPRVLSR
eukprot:4856949-Prymnesium_polylepis.1